MLAWFKIIAPTVLRLECIILLNYSTFVYPWQGRIQDFKIEGAQKMSSAHHERKAMDPYHSGGVHRAPLKVLEAIWFQMLSHTIRVLFWSILLIQN